MSARDLVAEIRPGLRDVEERIRRHPWLDALERGEVSRDALAAFAREQLLIIASDANGFSSMRRRFEFPPESDYLDGMLAGEHAALKVLPAFAQAARLRPPFEPIPECQAYPAYVAQLTRDGSVAEVAAAFLVNLEAWGGNCARMRDALRSRYRLSEEATTFFDLFSRPPDGFEERSLEVIDSGLRVGVDPRRIATAARLLQAYELMYWGGLPP